MTDEVISLNFFNLVKMISGLLIKDQQRLQNNIAIYWHNKFKEIFAYHDVDKITTRSSFNLRGSFHNSSLVQDYTIEWLKNILKALLKWSFNESNIKISPSIFQLHLRSSEYLHDNSFWEILQTHPYWFYIRFFMVNVTNYYSTKRVLILCSSFFSVIFVWFFLSYMKMFSKWVLCSNGNSQDATIHIWLPFFSELIH